MSREAAYAAGYRRAEQDTAKENAEFIARLVRETQDGLDAERKSETGSPIAMVVLRARLDTLLEVQANLSG